jgi:DNA-binding transcriptional ArsR family regulator
MAKERKEPAPESSPPPPEAYTLTDLDQIRILADPLRIRILEALAEERTTKQVAELLGEKATKLYHHVDALERVGLVKLARTRPNRGTLEKYYRAVARTFRADARVFRPAEGEASDEKTEALRGVMSTIFDRSAAELTELIESGDATKTLDEDGLVTFVEIRTSREEIDEIQRKLHDLVQGLTARCPEDAAEGEAAGEDADVERYRLLIAYYPLDPAKREGGDKS